MIEFKNINLKFPDIKLFENLNFKIESREKVCISGDSGKGKSTLLKMLQGYVLPDDGEIFIDNIKMDYHYINAIRDMMIWIPQNINLPVDNGSELMELMDISSNKLKVEDLLNQLKLEKTMLSKDFRKISGGQKQRIIIAICLSIEKNIILMDEPTSSLDTESIAALINTISLMENKTFVSASHNDQWLMEFGRVIKL